MSHFFLLFLQHKQPALDRVTFLLFLQASFVSGPVDEPATASVPGSECGEAVVFELIVAGTSRYLDSLFFLFRAASSRGNYVWDDWE